MEKDSEIKGDGNSYDFGARMLDPRVGRWFKMDPQSKIHPYDSPYMVSGNSPISIMDPDGERKRKITLIYDRNSNLVDTQVTLVNHSLIKEKVYRRDKVIVFGYTISNNEAVTYDYYDSVDIEIAVRDENGKIFGRKVLQKNVLADKRLEAVHPLNSITAAAFTNTSDYMDDNGLNDNLQGTSKGQFNAGLDFYLNEDDHIMNVRGLEKMNVGGVVEKVEVSELMAIGLNQSSTTSKIPFKKTTLGNIHNAGKTPDLLHTMADKIADALLDINEKMDQKSEQEKQKLNEMKPDSVTVCKSCHANGNIIDLGKSPKHFIDEGTMIIKNPAKE